MTKKLLERDIEAYLKKRVKELGGEIRKVTWIGRDGAPDCLVMLPPTHTPWVNLNSSKCHTIWFELKNPETVRFFPANAHERAQAREHELMRKMGQRVEVVGTFEQIDTLLS